MTNLGIFILFLLSAVPFSGSQAAGFQHAFAADPGGQPLEVGIWYPSDAVAKPATVGLTTMTVAREGAVRGNGLPLIVISHGTGGSFLGHVDTAIALADAGYVVAAVTHTGDNYADQSRRLDIMDRPRQISRVIDHMLSSWDARAAIDPHRIGMYGFSAGAFTTLVSIGGVPDFSRIGPMCTDHPGDYVCELVAGGSPAVAPPDTVDARDLRVRAAVVAAPALGFVFAPDGLKRVGVPVQLWRAEADTVLPYPRYADAVRAALPIAPEYHVVPRAGHFDFLAPCSHALAAVAPAICTSAFGFDRKVFHDSFNAAVIAFFDKNLDAN